MVLRVGGELAGLVNVYSSACDTSDSQTAVTQAASYLTSPDVNVLQDYNLTVRQFEIAMVCAYSSLITVCKDFVLIV